MRKKITKTLTYDLPSVGEDIQRSMDKVEMILTEMIMEQASSAISSVENPTPLEMPRKEFEKAKIESSKGNFLRSGSYYKKARISAQNIISEDTHDY